MQIVREISGYGWLSSMKVRKDPMRVSISWVKGSVFFPSRAEAFLGIVVMNLLFKKTPRRRNYVCFLMLNCAYMGDHGVGSVDTIGNVVGKCFFPSPTSLIAKSPIIISVTFIGQVDGRFLLFPFLIT